MAIICWICSGGWNDNHVVPNHTPHMQSTQMEGEGTIFQF